VTVKSVAVKLVEVLAISVTDELKSDTIELCHLVTLPTCPLNVNVVLFVPEHTDVEPAMEPPTETGFTVIVAVEELAEEHVPFLTTAL
jgi:hypothetical protein